MIDPEAARPISKSDVALALGELAIAISRLDMALAHLFEAITAMNPGPASAIYRSQSGTAARRAMVAAAAEAILEGRELDEFRRIEADYADLMGRRNRLLHDIWMQDENTGALRIFNPKGPKGRGGRMAIQETRAVDPRTISADVERADGLFREMQALREIIITRVINEHIE